MAYLLYKKSYIEKDGTENDDVCEFTPSLGNFFLPGETKGWKTAAVRLYFALITGGKANLFYIKSADGKILHTSYVLPKCAKFPFMEKGDFEIGPCHTARSARGQGLYGKVLGHITSDRRFRNAQFYMIVKENNLPSIRGIEKANFIFDGYVKPTRILKRYCRMGDR